MENVAFNQAYWLSKAPEVRTAFDVNKTEQEQRDAAAHDLMKRGYIIDREIMIWAQDPYKIMATREFYGYTWVPNAAQPATWAQVGGAPYDPKNPPAGSITVSTNIADYPPFIPPAPPAPAPTSYVGPLIFNGFYVSLPGNPAKDGDETIKDGVTYVLHTYPFGGWYTKKA